MTVTHSEPEPTVVELLARKFRSVQDISAERSTAISQKIIADNSPISYAAEVWLNTDLMPEYPQVEGYTPASLSATYIPTQVFTILIGLRRDPALALQMLKRFAGERNTQ